MNVKNHLIFSDFFSLKNKSLGTHLLFLATSILKPLFLLKPGLIFDEVAKLGKASCDAYNWGGWLIL